MAFRVVAQADDRVFLKFDSGIAADNGANPLRNIHQAVKRNDLKAVQACIAANQDLNVVGPDRNYPLANAAGAGQADIVDALIKAGAEVNKTAGNGAAALHYAAFKGHGECVRRLLAAGADVTIAAKNGMTPLEWAVAHKRADIVQILEPLTPDRHAALKAKNAVADPKTIDLFKAVQAGDVVGIERAAAGGANVNITNRESDTPLHKAVLYDHLANQSHVVRALINGGADIDATRKGGWTPLHLTAEHGQNLCAKILIQAGADVTLKGNNGMTALKIAQLCRSIEIVQMLKNATKKKEKTWQNGVWK